MKIYYPKKQVHTFWNPKYYLIKTSSTADMINNELKKKIKANMGCGKMIMHVIMAEVLESTHIEVHKLFNLSILCR